MQNQIKLILSFISALIIVMSLVFYYKFNSIKNYNTPNSYLQITNAKQASITSTSTDLVKEVSDAYYDIYTNPRSSNFDKLEAVTRLVNTYNISKDRYSVIFPFVKNNPSLLENAYLQIRSEPNKDTLVDNMAYNIVYQSIVKQLIKSNPTRNLISKDMMYEYTKQLYARKTVNINQKEDSEDNLKIKSNYYDYIIKRYSDHNALAEDYPNIRDRVDSERNIAWSINRAGEYKKDKKLIEESILKSRKVIQLIKENSVSNLDLNNQELYARVIASAINMNSSTSTLKDRLLVSKEIIMPIFELKYTNSIGPDYIKSLEASEDDWAYNLKLLGKYDKDVASKLKDYEFTDETFSNLREVY